MAITLLVTDRDLTVLGDPIANWSTLQCDLKFNQPASGTVSLPAYPEVMEQLQPGNRLVLIRDGVIWCAGPMEVPQTYTWDLQENADPGVVTVSFSDDLARIAGYLTYPDASKDFASQVTTADDVRTFTDTTTETIIRTLVSETCGPDALTARQIQHLALDTALGVGTSTSTTTRFDAVLDICRTVAAIDGLGFRTSQDGGQILFGVYQPRDLTASARFSRGLGNLQSVSFEMSAPTATAELVQGGDDPANGSTDSPAARVFVEVDSGAAADWYRVEKLLDNSGTTDTTQLTQAGNLAFGDDGPQASLATVTVDTDQLQAGRDFGLGDKVTVQLPTGLEVADLVQTISLAVQSQDDGEVVTSVVGSSDQTTSTATVQLVRQLARRLGRLETR